ncbi:hypothetical protein GFS60_06947 (plasmid) [Rhodococcus sp. WAY2]|nr:hypothetical protein GFS60_06947 [Rhodococcus sp. WAY2]
MRSDGETLQSRVSAAHVLARSTRGAFAAAQSRLHAHTITRLHTPTLARHRPDSLDRPDRLMPQDEGLYVTSELMNVTAADTADLHPEKGIILANLRQRDIMDFQRVRCGQHRGSARAGPHATKSGSG